MRILAVGLATFDEMAGGSARYLSGVVKALRDEGHTVRVLTAASVVGAPGYSKAGVGGQIGRALKRILILMPREGWAVLRDRPDVVNVHFALDGLGAVVAAWVSRVPVVVNFQGPWAEEARIDLAGRRSAVGTATRRAIERFVYRRARRLIVLSDEFGVLLAHDYGVDPSRIRVIPAGIDMPDRPLPDRTAARHRLGLRDGPTIVTVRRLVPRMGLDLAIRALPLMDRADATLAICGTGPERAALEALAASLGLSDRVAFLGRVPDDVLDQVYGAGDVCVVPSRALEGFGYVALEAFAMGTPVIAAATGGLIGLVGGLEPRWLVGADPTEIARALDAVLEQPAAFPDRDACRAYAATYAWPVIAPRIVAVFEEARAAS